LALATGMGATPAAAIDPFFPTFGNNGIDVIRYDLDLEVVPGPGTLDGGAELLILAERWLEEFSLDLAGLDVSRVTVNDVSADFEQANDKLIVMPREPIPRGSVFTLSVAYAGTPDPIPHPTAPGSGIELGWFTHRNASYVVSEPVGASTFYPANDEPTDKATFSIAVTVPADYTAAANGVLGSVRTTGSEKRFRWDMRQPMTTWLATVHVNRFRLQLTRAPDGTPIRVYYTAATPQADVDGYALSGEILTCGSWISPVALVAKLFKRRSALAPRGGWWPRIYRQPC
jgi:aminopeptidase N